jgi:putative polyhydroxyalkanoate system protein
MPNISIRRRHSLDHKKAKAAAQKIARDLDQRFDLAHEWNGDEVSFERPGLSGSMHVGKNEIRLDVQLSFLLLPLKGPIEQAIHKQLDAVLAKK